ncbi:MAG: hypothetical protein LUG50_02405 [Planctomycetaceae bacterium]|nr:hypothetical protein [Planctomycetaceae bacterium]
MPQHFDFLAKAKPAALYKLVEKLPLEEAAIVLTGVPHMLALQTLAYFPEEKQAPFVPAMREARNRPAADRDAVAGKIRKVLAAARQARDGQPSREQPAATPRSGDPVAATPGGAVPSSLNEPTASRPATSSGSPAHIDATTSSTPPGAADSLSAARPNNADRLPPSAMPTPRTPDAADPVRPARGGPPGRPPGTNPYAPAGDGTALGRPGGVAGGGSALSGGKRPSARLRDDDLLEKNDSRLFRDPLASVLSEDAPAKPASPLKGLGNKLKEILKTTHDEISKGLIANSSVADKLPSRKPSDARSAPRPAAKREPRPANFGKPQPWVPRDATESPINGPSLPGRPDSKTGNPMASPLAQAGLLDLIGRAQEKLLPKGSAGKKGRSGNVIHQSDARQAEPRRPAGQAGRKGRPEPAEGVVSSGVVVGNTPRVIGPRPPEKTAGRGKPDGGGARSMDGKAILAAILREAGPKVRHTVQDDDPALFKELRRRMFYFDDLMLSEDKALAQVFTAANADDSALALRFAAPKLRDRVLRVVSPGRARMLREAGAGRAGVDAIEAAQKRVLGVALQLQAAGRILIDPRDPDLARE